MEFLSKLFSEDSGVSSMRVMAMMSLIIGAGIAFAGMAQGKDLNQLSTLVGVFVGAAFGGKMVQKFAEVSGQKSAGSDKKSE